MNKVIEQANRDMLEGNRPNILKLKQFVDPSLRTSVEQVKSRADRSDVVQAMWLYANSLDADTRLERDAITRKGRRKQAKEPRLYRESYRREILKRIQDIGDSPYKELAAEILSTEVSIGRSLDQLPGWQRRLVEWRSILVWVIGVTVVVSGVAIIVQAF